MVEKRTMKGHLKSDWVNKLVKSNFYEVSDPNKYVYKENAY